MLEHIEKTDILKYAAGIMSDKEKAAVERHIGKCDVCLLKVVNAMKKKKDACVRAQGLFEDYRSDKLDKKTLAFVKDHLLICDDCLDKYRRHLEAKEAGALDITITGAYKSSLFDDIFSGKKMETSKKGINIGVYGKRGGHILVDLKSDDYHVSGVRVSLGKTTEAGFEAVFSAFTSSKGTARLGRRGSAATEKKKSKYSLHVSGLKKKIK
jgi:hypothetical protein